MTTTTLWPKCIILISGKRKSGKDYIAEQLQQRYNGTPCQILRLSGPLKKQYAEERHLDYEELLKSSAYKETYRADMIKWGEEKRKEEPYFFCEKTLEEANTSCSLLVISDARRKSDLQYFCDKYSDRSLFVRIEADESVRIQRGYNFTAGIDDAESECGLDKGVDWDFVVSNNGNNTAALDSSMRELYAVIDSRLQQVST